MGILLIFGDGKKNVDKIKMNDPAGREISILLVMCKYQNKDS